MLTAALLVLLSATPALPRYAVKFVDLSRYEVNKNHHITDATRNLCLAGYTFTDMIDTLPAAPISLVNGHPVGMWRGNTAADEKTVWICRFRDPSHAYGSVGNYPEFEGRLTPFVRTKTGWSVRTSSAWPKEERHHTLNFTRLPDQQIPLWALSYVKLNSTAGYEPQSNIDVVRLGSNTRLINLTYYPITSGYDACMHDAERVAAFVSNGRRTVPLGQLAHGLDCGQIVWVAPEGWFVVRASKGSRDGFAWFYPKR